MMNSEPVTRDDSFRFLAFSSDQDVMPTAGSTAPAFAEVKPLSHVKQVRDYSQGSWCVTMPCDTVIVRRWPAAVGSVASRPVVVGNCVWTNNCIGPGHAPNSAGPGGAGNHKFFLLFLVYIMVSGLHIASCVLYSSLFYYPVVRPTPSQTVANFMLGICGGVFAGVLGLFAVFHIFLVVADETTLSRKIAQLKGTTAVASPFAAEGWIRRLCVMCCCGHDQQVIKAMAAIMGDAAPLWQWPLPFFNPVWHSDSSSSPTTTSMMVNSSV
jgi:hypothetical protein